ncbi:MAG: hypothetical protein ACRC68_05750, partial [Clostridium sp.]
RSILSIILGLTMVFSLVGCSSIDNIIKKDSSKVEEDTNTDSEKDNSATTSENESVVDSTKTDSKAPDKDKPVVDNSKTENKALNVGMFVPNGSYDIITDGNGSSFSIEFLKGDGKSYEAIGFTGKGPRIQVYNTKNSALSKVYYGDISDKELEDKENLDYLAKADKAQEVVMLKEPLKVGTRWDNKEIVEVGENLKLGKITLKGAYVKTWEQVTSNGVKTVKVFYFSEGLGCVKYDVIVDGVSMERSSVNSVTKN